LDYDIVAKYHVDDEFVYDGSLDLVKAVLSNMCNGNGQGLDFFMHSDAPPGSGLGSSSTVVVALIGLLRHWKRLPMTNYEIAELAYHIERNELGIKGGMQDQYAAVFGGFNFIEFETSAVIVNPLRVDIEIINELQYNLLLCYTGKTRLSANIINTQVDNYIRRKEDVLAAMDELKNITIEMKAALLQNRLSDFGQLLHEAWKNKKKLAKQITTSDIDLLYETARENGALGGKILGAGGGGYLMLYCPFERKHVIAEELEKLGGQVVEFAFDYDGLQTWAVPS
jgi:D-glycero-alpha-D-manno-heptose-7-phosphate kinase